MSNITQFRNKYFLRNSLSIPFFYKKIVGIKRSVNNIIHLVMVGRIANGVLHDIVNPLTSLLLSININNPPFSEIEKSSKELSEYIRVIQGQLQNTQVKENFYLSKLIFDSCILLKHKALINNVRIINAIEQDFELYGNKIIMMRALLNLINNAIESYEKCPRDKNDVVISLYRSDDFINISIKDFGCGIPKNEQKKIFKYLYTNKENGTGIGLYTTNRNIKKQYAGKIKIESEPSKGTNFIIQLPLKISV